jgi:hypothetical protein
MAYFALPLCAPRFTASLPLLPPGSRPLALGVRVRDQPEGGAGGQAGGQDQGDQPDAHQPQQDIQQV